MICSIYTPTHTQLFSLLTSSRVELYDPYDPGSSDSELEVAQSEDHIPSTSSEYKDKGHQRLSTRRSRWDTTYSAPESRPFDRCNFSPETSPSESLGATLCHRLSEAYSPATESLDQQGFGSLSRPLEHSVYSADRTAHSSSTQLFPAAYRGQHTDGEERITVTEHRRSVTDKPYCLYHSDSLKSTQAIHTDQA